jgi:predicted dehydrogenase
VAGSEERTPRREPIGLRRGHHGRRGLRQLARTEVLLARRGGEEQRVGRIQILNRGFGDGVDLLRADGVGLRDPWAEQPAVDAVVRLANLRDEIRGDQEHDDGEHGDAEVPERDDPDVLTPVANGNDEVGPAAPHTRVIRNNAAILECGGHAAAVIVYKSGGMAAALQKIGIIGSGWGARVQAPAFAEAGFEVVNVKGHDWRTLLGSDVELVTITTPPSEHLEMAAAFLGDGKHVVSEKPTALDAAQAEEMVAVAERHPDRIAIIDHELRFLPSFQAARARIGELGGIRYLEARYASPSRGDRTREWTWWSDASRGGGILGAVGSHFIDMTRFLAGEIVAVQATLATFISSRSGRAVTADDFAALNLRLASGALAAMTFSAVASGPDEPSMLTIHGETHAMRLTGEELLLAKRNEPFTRVAGADMPPRRGNSAGGAFGSGTLALAHALRAALAGSRDALAPAATFRDGLAQQRVLDAARRSQREGGGWVEV